MVPGAWTASKARVEVPRSEVEVVLRRWEWRMPMRLLVRLVLGGRWRWRVREVMLGCCSEGSSYEQVWTWRWVCEVWVGGRV